MLLRLRPSSGRAPAALVLTVALLLLAPGIASAAGKVLVFGQADNGYEGTNTAQTLRSFGLAVDRTGPLPADLSPYSSVWYISAYAGMTTEEEQRVAAYIAGGGAAYLTGERPCCETLNRSVQRVLRSVLTDQDVQVGGLSDIPGPFTFNGSAAEDVTSVPNLLVDFIPSAPGGMQGIGNVSSRNVFASNGRTPVGAVWSEEDMQTLTGRVAILMDIDYLGDPDRAPILQNIQNFLDRGATCTNEGHHPGFAWSGPAPDDSPANCTTITTPATISWTARSDQGPVTMQVTGTGVTTDCTTGHGEGTATATCRLSNAQTTSRLRVTATDAQGESTRTYRVRPLNDPRNVPEPFSADSKWWEWPDEDGDGIPTHWEEQGVWVKGRFLFLPGADPQHKDLFLHYDFQQGHELGERMFTEMRRVFAAAPVPNPDGEKGIDLHIQRGTSIPESIVGDFDITDAGAIQQVTTFSGFAGSPRFGGGGVPQLYKWMLNFDTGPGRTIGKAFIKGSFGWTAFQPDAMKAALRVGDLPGPAVDFARATNATHELGHMLGLLHNGSRSEPARDPRYLSVMSYSFSNFGLPPAFGETRNRIDYARTPVINLDWQPGRSHGKLTFVPGQHGERPGFYAANNAERIDVDEPLPLEPTHEEAVRSAPPAAVNGFVTDHDIPATPAFPTLEGAEATVRAGETVRIVLNGSDPAGGPVSYVVDEGLTRGSVTPWSGGLYYTAERGTVGDDVLRVRAVGETLGSDQATVVVHVVPQPAQPPPLGPSTPGTGGGTPPPGGGGGTGGGGTGGSGTPGATAAPRLTGASVVRLRGRRAGRARLARVTLRSTAAGRVVARVTRLPLKVCRRARRCPRAKSVITVRRAIKAGRTVLTLTVRGRRVPKGRYTIRLTPSSTAGRTGRAVVRRLVVR